jgi:RNA polymerase sigma-70 factor (ECF subfamily)
MVVALYVSERSDAPLRWLDKGTLMSSDDEFEQFFLAHYDAVLSILVLTTGDRERATDATQEAFIKAYSKWSRIRNYDAPSAWVRRVAINASHDSFRSDRRRRRREQALPSEPLDAQTDRYSSDSTAHELLHTLPARQREVATLFYVDDCSVAEIAAILDLTEGTVKYHLSHAREGLRRLLADDQGAP